MQSGIKYFKYAAVDFGKVLPLKSNVLGVAIVMFLPKCAKDSVLKSVLHHFILSESHRMSSIASSRNIAFVHKIDSKTEINIYSVKELRYLQYSLRER